MTYINGVLHGILRRKPVTIRTIRKKLEKQDREVVRQTTGDYIKDYRKKIQWEWFTEVNTAHFFEYCLLKANWKPGKFKGIEIPRGSFIASLNTISTECGLSIQQIRTAIKHLESTQELTRNQHGKYTVFTVNNYCMYQDSNTISNTEVTQNQHEDNTVLTRNQHGINTEVTTIEERKNNKEREEKEEGEEIKNNTSVELPEPKERIHYQEIADMYNYICISLPKLQTFSDGRKKSVKRIIDEYGIDTLRKCFEMAEESDFLSGRKTNWKASFDWLIKPANFVKVIDGNYLNEKKQQPSPDDNFRLPSGQIDWDAFGEWANEVDREIEERKKQSDS